MPVGVHCHHIDLLRLIWKINYAVDGNCSSFSLSLFSNRVYQPSIKETVKMKIVSHYILIILVFPIPIFPITFNSMITLFFFLSLASFLVFIFLIIVTAIIFYAGLYTDPWRCTKIRYIRLTTAILRVSCSTAKYEIRHVQSVLLPTSVEFFFPFLSTCQFDVQLFNLDS